MNRAEKMSTQKVLIAGCGDLGLRIARLLLMHTGTEVWALRRQIPAISEETLPDPVQANIHWIEADLTKIETLDQIPSGVTHIIYAASADGRNEASYRAIYLNGLENIITACKTKQLKQVIFISSTAVYGDHEGSLVDEMTISTPQSFNGRIMLEAETWLAAQTDIASTVSLRLSGIYGPGRQFLINRLRAGLVTAPPSNQHWVNRIHIDDAARAVAHIMGMSEPQNLYLVTDSTPLPMRVLYEAIALMVGGPVPAMGPAPLSVGSKRLSNARLLSTGFAFDWPDSRLGHAALLQNEDS